METSILISTKKILGIASDYTAFDLDIITHINAALATLTQLGIGPTVGYTVDNDTSKWEDFITTDVALRNMTKTYVYLKVRSLFDPPTTSYHVDAVKEQLKEYEWRLSQMREGAIP